MHTSASQCTPLPPVRPGATRLPPLPADGGLLQAPVQPVLEGDELVLRCRGWWDSRPSSVSFFRNGELLRGPGGQEDTLLLAPAQRHHSGRYHCTGGGYWSSFKTKPNEVVVHGELGWGAVGLGGTTAGPGARQWGHRPPLGTVSPELFSVPELSVEGSREPPEGSNLTLVCVTRGSPLRPPVTLRHLFYRDGVVVVGPQGSPRHLLQALALRDSGSYACEARAEAAKVQKRSNPVTITVRSERLGGGRIPPPDPPVPPVLSQVLPICSPGPNTHPRAPSILTQDPSPSFLGSPHPFLGPPISPHIPHPSPTPHPSWAPPIHPQDLTLARLAVD